MENMYIMKVAYDGRHRGFQSQPHGNTVCDHIMDALMECGYSYNKNSIVFHGGRTDKGVSAIGNFIITKLKGEPNLSHIYSKLKNKGIWILGYKKIDAIPKIEYRHYRYILPKLYGFNYDIDLMIQCSKKLIGTHSFHNLSKRDRSKEKSPIRTVYDIKINNCDHCFIIDIIGKSFLWNMVRKIIKVLSEVGMGNKPLNWVDDLLNKNHREGVPPVPPEGLILVESKTNIDYIYSSYVLNRYKREWMERYFKRVMKFEVCKNMIDSI